VIAYKNGFMFYTDDNSEIKKFPIEKLHKGLLDPDVYFWGGKRSAWDAYFPDFIRNILLGKKQEYIIGIKMLNQQVIESEAIYHNQFIWSEEVLVASILSDMEYVFEILGEFEKCEALDIFTNIKTIPSFSEFHGYPDEVFKFLVKIGHYKVKDEAEYYEHISENLKKEYVCNQS